MRYSLSRVEAVQTQRLFSSRHSQGNGIVTPMVTIPLPILAALGRSNQSLLYPDNMRVTHALPPLTS